MYVCQFKLLDICAPHSQYKVHASLKFWTFLIYEVFFSCCVIVSEIVIWVLMLCSVIDILSWEFGCLLLLIFYFKVGFALWKVLFIYLFITVVQITIWLTLYFSLF